MQKITEVNTPILGKTYLVPCVFNVESCQWMPKQWCPILYAESSHSDPELNLNQSHFHYDTRFISPKKFFPDAAATVFVINRYRGTSFKELENSGDITWQVKKCFRTEQLLPHRPEWESQIVKKLEQIHAYDRMENMICPHRGTCLKGHHQKYFHINQKGIVCPAHGLAWELKTGFLIEQ